MASQPAVTRYEIIDSQTGQTVGTYTNRRRAYARADKLDQAYGAVRYVVRPVFDHLGACPWQGGTLGPR